MHLSVFLVFLLYFPLKSKKIARGPMIKITQNNSEIQYRPMEIQLSSGVAAIGRSIISPLSSSINFVISTLAIVALGMTYHYGKKTQMQQAFPIPNPVADPKKLVNRIPNEIVTYQKKDHRTMNLIPTVKTLYPIQGEHSKIYEHRVDNKLIIKKKFTKGLDPNVLNEYTLGATLNHPNIARSKNLFIKFDNENFTRSKIVMEKIDGKEITPFFYGFLPQLNKKETINLLLQAKDCCSYLFNNQIGWNNITNHHIFITNKKMDLVICDLMAWKKIEDCSERAKTNLLGAMEIVCWIIKSSLKLSKDLSDRILLEKKIIFPSSFFNEQIEEIHIHSKQNYSQTSWMIYISQKLEEMNEIEKKFLLDNYFDTVITNFDALIQYDPTLGEKSNVLVENPRNRVLQQLTIAEIAEEDWPSISRTAKKWYNIAIEKYLTIHCGRSTDHKYSLYRLCSSLFSDSKEMCKCIVNNISHKIDPPVEKIFGLEQWDTVLVCRLGDEIQAIALHNKKKNKLGYIATHPNNIIHELNEEAIRVKGAGTKIMLYLAQETIRLNSVLKLKAIKGAKSFYEKLSFDNSPEDGDSVDRYYGITPMKLTSEKIKDLIHSKIAPYDQLVRNPCLDAS